MNNIYNHTVIALRKVEYSIPAFGFLDSNFFSLLKIRQRLSELSDFPVNLMTKWQRSDSDIAPFWEESISFGSKPSFLNA